MTDEIRHYKVNICGQVNKCLLLSLKVNFLKFHQCSIPSSNYFEFQKLISGSQKILKETFRIHIDVFWRDVWVRVFMKQKIKKEKKGCEATAKFLRVSPIVTNVPTQALCPFVDQKKKHCVHYSTNKKQCVD